MLKLRCYHSGCNCLELNIIIDIILLSIIVDRPWVSAQNLLGVSVLKSKRSHRMISHSLCPERGLY